MILMKTYFQGLPKELEEAAKIDGCSTLQTFVKIVIPISMPIVATICIFVGVAQWNSWFDAFMYVNDNRLQPVQTYLYRIIAQMQAKQDDPYQSQQVERNRKSVLTIALRDGCHHHPAHCADLLDLPEALHQGRHDRRDQGLIFPERV